MDFDKVCDELRRAAGVLSRQNARQKNRALESVAARIDRDRAALLQANSLDVRVARESGMSESLVERLALDEKKISGMVEGIRAVIKMRDPIGEEVAGWTHENGMRIRQARVPIGVVAIIYESRPNVTTDAFCLAYKSGNAILLRGSSSALESNRTLELSIKAGLREASGDGVESAVALSESRDHGDVGLILGAVGKIDVVIPRGGKKLIQSVARAARVPVIETGSGVCHLYVDENADAEMAARIADNAKTQRPGACNAIECILVHEKIAREFLPLLAERFGERVELRADDECRAILERSAAKCRVAAARESDWGFEFLDNICALRAVKSLDEAVSYINAHGTKHSECIVTRDRDAARAFQSGIDAACVYVNASTRFTDGGEFGFGAELGISTQKLHARGPMGIKALTTTKYFIDGEGQTR